MRPLHLAPLLGLTLLACASTTANNIQVQNLSLAGNTGTSVQVQFDLSWENSWREGGLPNWDAAWVFVKYRTNTAGPWLHANLTQTGHVAAPGSQIQLGVLTPANAYNALTNPAVGVFILRDAPGTGNLNLPGTQLQWNYAALGLSFFDIAQVQVFAIEMVNVPQGAFYIGSGGTETGSFTDGAWVSGGTIPLRILSENALTFLVTGGVLWGTSSTGTSTIGPTGGLLALYPKGFGPFYCMKYEVSQQGYVDFLNTLSYTQQTLRTATTPSSTAGTGALSSLNADRNGIDIRTAGVANSSPAVYACNLNGNSTYGEATDGGDIACNWLSWGDLSAYLDWSGLRPMTELEYEKACRGTLAPVANELPWGALAIVNSPYTLANAGAGNEGIATNYSTTAGNALYSLTEGTIDGPVRVGTFAANSSNSGRVSSGGSYYGIMELGGNVYERIVSVGSLNGRAFTGTHGNGVLGANGDPNGSTWPAPTTGSGAGYRGGAWDKPVDEMRVSDRSNASIDSAVRTSSLGGRGVRSAP